MQLAISLTSSIFGKTASSSDQSNSWVQILYTRLLGKISLPPPAGQ